MSSYYLHIQHILGLNGVDLFGKINETTHREALVSIDMELVKPLIKVDTAMVAVTTIITISVISRDPVGLAITTIITISVISRDPVGLAITTIITMILRIIPGIITHKQMTRRSLVTSAERRDILVLTARLMDREYSQPK